MKTLKDYNKLNKNAFFAELIGITLGDGCITKLERTESLRVICNSNDIKYVKYASDLIRRIFNKKPTYTKRKDENAIDIRLYQKFISRRLGLPSGDKIKNNAGVPRWIYRKNIYMVNCLKGLFDTDGHFRISLDNYLHVIELKNHCQHILQDAYKMLKLLGYNPQFGKEYVRLACKKEVYDFVELINFRNRHCPVM
jgi:intein/homing endonuclease